MANSKKKDEEVVDDALDSSIAPSNPETSDTTQGFGTDPGFNQGVDAGEENEQDEDRGPIDPVTNQPLSDFQFSLPADHPDADAVRVANSKIKVGSAMGRVGAAQNLIDTRAAAAEKQQLNKESREITEAANTPPDAVYAMIPPDVYRAREQARVMAEAKTLQTNVIQPGGRFKVGDHFVDADGKRIND